MGSSDAPGKTVFHVPPSSYALDGRRSSFTMLCCLLAVLVLLSVAPRCVVEASRTDFASKMLPPSMEHPFGTDQMGRDMLARTVSGLATSVSVGLVASLSSGCLALALAALAAFGGRVADGFVSWLIDIIMGLPHMVLLILVSCALGGGYWGVTLGISLTHWPRLARVLRSELMRVRVEQYLKVSASLGLSRVRIIVRHAVPAIVPQVIVGMMLAFPDAILHEASITFLGFGLSPDEPAIGVILSESMGYLTAGAWWLAVMPGASLSACVLAVGAVGSAVRKRMDVRSRREWGAR